MQYILGIDYGSKFCGLAKAELGSGPTIALPWKLLKNEELKPFILEHIGEIKAIVLGLSLTLKGEENKINKEILELKEFLEKEDLQVYLQDERFSSQAALAEKRLLSRKQKSRKTQSKERLDSKAAAIILQNFLDSRVKYLNLN